MFLRMICFIGEMHEWFLVDTKEETFGVVKILWKERKKEERRRNNAVEAF